MTALDKKYFQGEKDLPQDVVTKLLVEDFHNQADKALKDLGWEGQLVSSVGLTLNADGSLVHSAQFQLRGRLHQDAIPVTASTVWEGAPKGAVVHITLPDCSNFKFTGGELVSDYLHQAAVKFAVTKDGNPLLPTDWEANKIGLFSLRLIAHLDKASNTKTGPHFRVSVLLYPLSVEELADLCDATQSVAWPGLRILEAKSEIFPRAPAGLWGCPLLPLMNTHLRAEGVTTTPSGACLRHAIAELLRSAALPTACRSWTSLAKQMAEIQDDPASCEPRTPAVIWPPASRPETNGGKTTPPPFVYSTIQTTLGSVASVGLVRPIT